MTEKKASFFSAKNLDLLESRLGFIQFLMKNFLKKILKSVLSMAWSYLVYCLFFYTLYHLAGFEVAVIALLISILKGVYATKGNSI